ncbi:hypothetical protein J3F83DRAFT_752290 [Trichoderma novae-zelandiae]
MFRPARNNGPSAATPAASSSRSTHEPVHQPVSQSTNNALSTHTSAAPTFHRPRRFLLLAREKLEPAIAPAPSTARVASRPGPRLVDPIESDSSPTKPASRHSQQIRPRSRNTSNPVPANHPVASSLSSSRIGKRSIPQSERSSDAVAASSSSRITQRPIPQPQRVAGPSGVEPGIVPSTLANRSSRPFPLPGKRIPGSITTPAAPAAYAAYQPAPQPVSRTGPIRTSIASTSRIAQQPMHQPTRTTLPAHTSTSSASRMAQQLTTHPPRNSSSHAPSASLSRTTQQSTFRSMRATAAPSNTPGSSVSAPILEFICLYTHDLRRKKKRWQDGKLKFHTFNKKYMVYDDGGGFVGDGHWQGDESEVAEGLEMNLDRGMAIVQLLECTGSKEQDLGEVLGKRVREVEERRVSAAAKFSPTTAPSNPAKRARGAAVVVEAAPPTTMTTIISLPPRNGGAWSTHAMDLLGMTRPRRR